MKTEFDKEIEALLRGHKKDGARGGPFAAPVALDDSAHLDADELSSYAENALPPSARARYSAHLADCDDCRHAATTLALAAGAATAGARESAATLVAASAASPASRPAGEGLRAWLGALFSPRAMRYAVPLLAVALVGVVGYVALRSRQQEGLVANRTGQQQSPRPVAVTTDSSASQSSANTNAAVANTSTTNASAPDENPPATQPADASKDAATKVVAPELARETQPDGADARAVTRTDEDAPSEVTVTSRPPAPSAAPSVADASRTAPELSDTMESNTRGLPKASEPQQRGGASADELARVEKERGANNVSRMESNQRNQQMEEGPSGARAETKKRAPPSTVANSAARGKAESDAGEFASRRARRPGDSRRDADDAGERREVAGYQFRRQGGAWVDVRYGASMATTNVSRGSERFRSLAADFPEVGRISAQLPGTVIVLIRGRAYRID